MKIIKSFFKIHVRTCFFLKRGEYKKGNNKIYIRMGDLCPVCLAELDTEYAHMPGCGHKLHVHCMINSVQYDTRCPVCRHLGENVVTRQYDLVLSIVAEEDAQEREWRRYTAKRRRVLRSNPHLKKSMDALKQLRSEMKACEVSLTSTFRKECRHVWKSNARIVSLKGKMRKLRRRELALSRALQSGLEELIGPEP